MTPELHAQQGELEFTFVGARDGGEIVISIPDHPITWTTKPFGERRRSLHGVEARIIPLELLRSGKRQARETADEAAKDVADSAALADV